MDDVERRAMKWEAVSEAMGEQLAAARAVVSAWAALCEATPLDVQLDVLDRALGDLDAARQEVY